MESDVVRIETSRHGTRVVQFTRLGSETASYRWRYRPSSTQKVSIGIGQVIESYDRKEMPDGSYRVSPRTDHDTKVRAGEINFEWSAGGQARGWLYYNPDRVRVSLLPSEAFERDF